ARIAAQFSAAANPYISFSSFASEIASAMVGREEAISPKSDLDRASQHRHMTAGALTSSTRGCKPPERQIWTPRIAYRWAVSKSPKKQSVHANAWQAPIISPDSFRSCASEKTRLAICIVGVSLWVWRE